MANPGLVQLKIYAGAYHGFDRAGSWQEYAPLARDRHTVLHCDRQVAEDARRRAVAFLLDAFASGR